MTPTRRQTSSAPNDGLIPDFVVQPLPAGSLFGRRQLSLSSEQLTPRLLRRLFHADTPADTPAGRTMNWPLFLGGAGVLPIVLALGQPYGASVPCARSVRPAKRAARAP